MTPCEVFIRAIHPEQIGYGHIGSYLLALLALIYTCAARNLINPQYYVSAQEALVKDYYCKIFIGHLSKPKYAHIITVL